MTAVRSACERVALMRLSGIVCPPRAALGSLREATRSGGASFERPGA
jgi:hypothetical protein